MKNVFVYLFLIMVIVALFGFTYSFAQEKIDGKKLFVDQKCSTCHTVAKAEITSKKKDAADLSELNTERNSDFWTKYLKKEEKLDGDAHKTSFKGTDEELKALINWLESLNEKAKSKNEAK
jgi:mono/diheme cytochrome c family protein